MINKIVEYLKDKNVAILGFGLEGRSTLKFFLNHLPENNIAVIDQNPNAIKLDDNRITYHLGSDYLDYINDFDLIIKTPGISLIDKTIKPIVTSQFDLFLNNTSSTVIGVTGTKGKSTTTSLIYNIIKEQKDNTFLVGNIGIPIFDLIDSFNEESIIVAEMSAHQLYDIKKSPHISIITNLFEEHLDYFYNLDNYYNSKLNIFKYQSENDYAIYLKDNLDLENRVNSLNIKSTIIPLGEDNIVNNKILLDSKEVFDLTKEKKLIGHFNDLNIMMSLEVAKILDLDLEKASNTVASFEGLEHRMKLIREVNKRFFYDDTLATIPKATINSIKSIPGVKTLILGGMDRNINYDELIKYLKESNLKTIICQPETGKHIYDQIKDLTNKNIYYIEELEEAVKISYENTNEQEAILLSPAAPSYNVYKNYADKSEHYLKYIDSLK